MLRVAAIQMQSGEDIRANVQLARDLLDQALERGVDLVAYPENFLINSENARTWIREAQTKKGVLIETLQEWAAENSVWILAGGIAMQGKKQPGKRARKITNSSLLIDADGEVLAQYDKMHLFDVKLRGQKAFQESSLVQAGKKPVVAETPWGRMGLSICYDLRFPELYRAYSEAGCRVIFTPSHFNEATGRAHWDALT
jgi:nitrilase